MIRKTAMVILYLPANQYMLKVSNENLFDLTEDNSNENLLKKQPPVCSIKKGSYLGKLIGKHLSESVFFNKFSSLKPATLLKRASGQGVFL